MKKLVKLSLILLTAMCIMGNVYATLNCNVNIITAKTEYAKNEEFTVDVNLANIQSEEGIIALGGTLDYDKESLTLEKMEGKNGWANPSYNEVNGKFATDRASVTTSDETVFTITFKVNETSKENVEIALKGITISDGEESNKIELINKTIKIADVISDTDPDNTDPDKTDPDKTNPDNTDPDKTDSDKADPDKTNPDKTNPDNQNPDKTNTGKDNKAPSTNGVGNNGIYQNGSLPKTGEGNIALFVVPMVIFAIIVIISFVRIKIINRKERMEK